MIVHDLLINISNWRTSWLASPREHREHNHQNDPHSTQKYHTPHAQQAAPRYSTAKEQSCCLDSQNCASVICQHPWSKECRCRSFKWDPEIEPYATMFTNCWCAMCPWSKKEGDGRGKEHTKKIASGIIHWGVIDAHVLWFPRSCDRRTVRNTRSMKWTIPCSQKRQAKCQELSLCCASTLQPSSTRRRCWAQKF